MTTQAVAAQTSPSVDASPVFGALPTDSLIQQGEKLTGAGDESGAGEFGSGVALSADGNTALVGGPSDGRAPGTCCGPGAAWIFTRTGTSWTQLAKLTGAEEVSNSGEDSQFGTAVALSADGNTALIGSATDNKGAGAVWVFTRSGTTWSQQGPKLTVGTSRNFFGYSVALSGDGNTAVIGGWGAGPEERTGAAWVFTRSGGTWTQGQKLTGGEEVPHIEGAEELRRERGAIRRRQHCDDRRHG